MRGVPAQTVSPLPRFSTALNNLSGTAAGLLSGRLNAALCLLLLLSAAVRLYHLTAPPCDYHDWRQTITLMVARDFARNGFDLLHPHLLWLGHGDKPAYFAAEFSLQSVFAAILYRLFGESDAAGRIVVIAFSLSGIWFLYALVRKGCGRQAAFAAAFIYAMLPTHIFFGRVFMPDIPAISLALGGLYCLYCWAEAGARKLLAGAAVFTSLAMLQKLTAGIVLLPICYLLASRYGRRTLHRLETWIFAAAVTIPVFAWYTHSWNLSLENGFQIMQPAAAGANLKLWLSRPFLVEIGTALYRETFSPAGLAICVLGLCWPPRNKIMVLFRLWFIGAACLLLSIPLVLRGNHYYLSLLMPAAAALGGIALVRVAQRNRYTAAVGVLVLLVYAFSALTNVAPLYALNLFPWQLGAELTKATAPADLIVTENGGSPGILYYADRRGWFLENDFDAGLIGRLRDRGASWYADSNPDDALRQTAFVNAMDRRFHRVHVEPVPWLVYRLR